MHDSKLLQWVVADLYLCIHRAVSATLSSTPNVTATALSSTQILVSWEYVDQEITAYEVLYEAYFDVPMMLTVNTSLALPEKSVILRDLEEYVNYSISVRAYTNENEGPYSVGVTVITMEDGKCHGKLFMLKWSL